MDAIFQFTRGSIKDVITNDWRFVKSLDLVRRLNRSCRRKKNRKENFRLGNAPMALNFSVRTSQLRLLSSSILFSRYEFLDLLFSAINDSIIMLHSGSAVFLIVRFVSS